MSCFVFSVYSFWCKSARDNRYYYADLHKTFQCLNINCILQRVRNSALIKIFFMMTIECCGMSVYFQVKESPIPKEVNDTKMSSSLSLPPSPSGRPTFLA
jgi:hypothetical protein